MKSLRYWQTLVAPTVNNEKLLFYLLFILIANGFSPGGSGTTIKHNTHHTK
jgi:hypothetical protein